MNIRPSEGQGCNRPQSACVSATRLENPQKKTGEEYRNGLWADTPSRPAHKSAPYNHQAGDVGLPATAEIEKPERARRQQAENQNQPSPAGRLIQQVNEDLR